MQFSHIWRVIMVQTHHSSLPHFVFHFRLEFLAHIQSRKSDALKFYLLVMGKVFVGYLYHREYSLFEFF